MLTIAWASCWTLCSGDRVGGQLSSGPTMQAQPQVQQTSTARRRPLPSPKRRRHGMAVLGNPDEVDHTSLPHPKRVVFARMRSHNSDRRESFGRKGRVGEIGSDTPSLGVNRRTRTARVVRGYEVTLKRMPACRKMGCRIGVGTSSGGESCHDLTTRNAP